MLSVYMQHLTPTNLRAQGFAIYVRLHTNDFAILSTILQESVLNVLQYAYASSIHLQNVRLVIENDLEIFVRMKSFLIGFDAARFA